MLAFHIIIPARFQSTRLANKLMFLIGDKILLQHTYEKAMAAGAASVTVATDDVRIFDHMQALGAEVVMTKNTHETGTDRLAETVDLLGLADDALVVNVQGDEPLIPVCLIHQVVHNLALEPTAAIATLYEPITQRADIHNPAIVKVVLGDAGFASYFSRAPIPFDRDSSVLDAALPNYYRRHLGLYAYRAHFLRRYSSLPPAPTEALEKLEQLRALYSGYKIHVAEASAYCPPGVDTAEDLQNIIEVFHETA